MNHHFSGALGPICSNSIRHPSFKQKFRPASLHLSQFPPHAGAFIHSLGQKRERQKIPSNARSSVSAVISCRLTPVVNLSPLCKGTTKPTNQPTEQTGPLAGRFQKQERETNGESGKVR
mmetsp:Transcript_41092/g.81078  ORF Transcript_41092/g.81078 Transcript_41092/m.81078 type:complete len:119 (-) Transcript_41092:2443-2799(-)